MTMPVMQGSPAAATDIVDDATLEFNYGMARWARPERLALLHPVAGELVADAAHGAEAQRWLSRFILESWNLAEPFCFEVESENRLTLLQPKTLERLTEQAGLLVFAPAMQSTISRVQREQIVAELGTERRQFAMTRYPLFRKLVDGIEPQTGEPKSVTLDQIRAAGWQLLFDCFSRTDAAFIKRLELKLPVGIDPEIADNGASMESTWPLFRRLLKLEWPQEWTRCFC